MKIAYLTRKEFFSCAHRLNNNILTKEENIQIFGKCNHENGHGHNYSVTVTLRGEIDLITGMVFNLEKLKKILKDQVLDLLDHKNLDKDVSFFETRPSTVENLAVFIWEQIAESVGRDKMYKVKVKETFKNSAVYMGE
ncbi:hypothetical protein BB561_002724 [Smittium simulii]|uniref:6-pyruvoyl tetrahydrobiopterin synthase n=1 Tax=Smittium simulii TaxID=133385 RepID=A0A2T9YPH7_9FUNG|nr:hypothetical protein BB561_002724 [Smittium simulii]